MRLPIAAAAAVVLLAGPTSARAAEPDARPEPFRLLTDDATVPLYLQTQPVGGDSSVAPDAGAGGGGAGADHEDIAKQLQNPVASLISVNLLLNVVYKLCANAHSSLPRFHTLPVIQFPI